MILDIGERACLYHAHEKSHLVKSNVSIRVDKKESIIMASIILKPENRREIFLFPRVSIANINAQVCLFLYNGNETTPLFEIDAPDRGERSMYL